MIWCITAVVYFLLAPVLTQKNIGFNDDIRLNCDVKWSVSVGWVKNGKQVNYLANDRLVRHKEGRVLKIKNVTGSDAGIYSCIDLNTRKMLKSYNVYVIEVHQKERQKPYFKHLSDLRKQRNVVKPAGNNLEFDCLAGGTLPIRYSWKKNNRPLINRRVDPSMKTNQAKLKMIGLVRSDTANYTCRAENDYGHIEYTMHLNVQDRIRASPYIEKATMKNQTKYVGENVSIFCYELITGTIPGFLWLKWRVRYNATLLNKYLMEQNGVESVDKNIAEVINGKYYHPTKSDRENGRFVVRGVELTLNNVTKEDTGSYTCIAINHIGIDFATMYLHVIDRTGDLEDV